MSKSARQSRKFSRSQRKQRTQRTQRKQRKSQRSQRKQRKSQRSQRKQRKSQRRSRGGAALSGAPLSFSLSGDWSSKMSQGQGGDYLKYHVGQHGGAAMAGAPLSSLGETLPMALHGPARIGALDAAMSEIAGLKDQAGGRRKSKKSKKSKRHTRRRGGAMGYAPFPSAGMLLADYSKAGITPQWKSGVEFDAATAREAHQ